MSSPIVEAKLWRTDHRGTKLEDITAGLIQASVQMDPENDQTYALDAIMEWDAYQPLREYIDWVVPEITVTWPDGTIRKGPLGLYLLIDPATVRGETQAYAHLRGMDNLWLLSAQGFDDDELPTKRRGLVGVKKSDFMRTLLQSMVVSERAADHVQYAIPPSAATFRRSYEWSIEEKKLAVANEVLEGMGCWPLWATKRGVLTTRQMGTTMLQMQHPVRTYIANIPPGFTVAPRLLPIGGIASEIVGDIRTAPGFDDLLNTILVINNDSKLGKIFVEQTVTDPKNTRSAMHERKRKVRRRRHNKTIDDPAIAKQIGNGILDKLGTYNEIYEFDAVIDPQPEMAREVIDILAWDALGRAIGDNFGRSKALVHRVGYTFSADEGIMTITAGRIDRSEGGLTAVSA